MLNEKIKEQNIWNMLLLVENIYRNFFKLQSLFVINCKIIFVNRGCFMKINQVMKG